jgi:superfamily II DNA or RNA helicase
VAKDRGTPSSPPVPPQGRAPTPHGPIWMVFEHDMGVFVAPPGIRKTVLGTYLIARRSTDTWSSSTRRPLLEQGLAQLSIFLALDEKETGRIGAGKRTANTSLEVAMIQSIGRRGCIDHLVAD